MAVTIGGRPFTSSIGTIGSEPVAVAILGHPSTPGFPTCWHARGYGLFAANTLGRKDPHSHCLGRARGARVPRVHRVVANA